MGLKNQCAQRIDSKEWMEDEGKRLIKRIWNKYLRHRKNDSSHGVGAERKRKYIEVVPDDLRKELGSAIRAKSTDVNIFNNALESVDEFLRTRVHPNFAKSEVFIEYIRQVTSHSSSPLTTDLKEGETEVQGQSERKEQTTAAAEEVALQPPRNDKYKTNTEGKAKPAPLPPPRTTTAAHLDEKSIPRQQQDTLPRVDELLENIYINKGIEYPEPQRIASETKREGGEMRSKAHPFASADRSNNDHGNAYHPRFKAGLQYIAECDGQRSQQR